MVLNVLQRTGELSTTIVWPHVAVVPRLSSPVVNRELLHESILVFGITSVSPVPGPVPDISLGLSICGSKE